MTRWSRTAACGLAVLLTCGTEGVRAEVRLQTGAAGSAPTVRVGMTLAGPWSPLGPLDGRVLNPHGDETHDSYPGIASDRASVLAAWVKPGAGLAFSAGESRWSATQLIADAAADGAPVTRTIGAGFGVVWQSSTSSGIVRLATTSTEGTLGAVLDVVDGTLLGVAQTTSTRLTVVAISADGTVKATVVVFALPDPGGIPVPIIYRTVVLGRVPSVTIGIEPDPIPIPSVLEGTRHDRTPYALVTWWQSPSELQYIELAEDGPVFPVTTLQAHGNAKYSQALVNQAVHEVRDR